MSYYNPDGTPIHDEKQQRRTVVVRFKTQQDLLDFNEKTGMKLNKSIKTVEFPISNTLIDMFED